MNLELICFLIQRENFIPGRWKAYDMSVYIHIWWLPTNNILAPRCVLTSLLEMPASMIHVICRVGFQMVHFGLVCGRGGEA